MVLIQTVSVDAINTALIALQRGQSIVVGGDKGQTINNITVKNQGSNVDFTDKINALGKQIENLEKKDKALESEDERLEDRIDNLTQIGISDFIFTPYDRLLTLVLTNGNTYSTTIPPAPFTMELNGNTLIIQNASQTEEVELPFIPLSQKGVANGVATLDSNGRVPYSQLPESAMEFKGEWDASTNTPHLEDGEGTNGDFYIVSTGGTVNFGTTASPHIVTFYPNDRVIYEGSTSEWKRLPAGEVSSVNGLSGDVVLNGTNVNYSNASGSPTLKAKIDDVQAIAETQADWSETNQSSPAYIKNKPSLPSGQQQANWTQTNSSAVDFIKNKIPIWITTGSADDNMSPIDSVTDGSMRPITSNAVYDKANSLDYMDSILNNFFYELFIGAYCNTASGTQAKLAKMREFAYQNGCAFPITFDNANSYNGKITLNINSTGAKDVWINGSVSSSSNKTLPAGTYICFCESNAYKIDTSWCVPYARKANSANSASSATTATNATKLGNISVQTSSIGGGSTETGAHWAYIVKAKFTATSGYIVYSNGFKIQWTKTTTTSQINYTFPVTFTETPWAFWGMVSNSSTGLQWGQFRDVAVHSLSKTNIQAGSIGSVATQVNVFVIGY